VSHGAIEQNSGTPGRQGDPLQMKRERHRAGAARRLGDLSQISEACLADPKARTAGAAPAGRLGQRRLAAPTAAPLERASEVLLESRSARCVPNISLQVG
jgi:hypothetical protein